MAQQSYIFKAVGGNVKISSFPQAAYAGQEKIIGYFDRSQVQMDYNVLDNTVSVTIAGSSSFTIDNVNTANLLTINTVLGGAVQITSVALFDTNYSLLFPKLGGGSGSTPDLQQVCNVGFTTDTFILQQADDKGIYSTDTLNTMLAEIGTSSLNDSGHLKIKNKAAVVTTLFADVNSTPEAFRFKDNLGNGGTLQTTFKNFLVNLTTGNFVADIPGVYEIRTADLVNNFKLPDPALFPGDEIVLISTDNVNPTLLDAANAPVQAGGSTIYNIVGVNAMQRHISINGTWRGIEVF